MEDTPFVAFSNNELKDKPEATTHITCPICQEKHKIIYGKSDGKINKILGFYNCGKETYLATVENKLVI